MNKQKTNNTLYWIIIIGIILSILLAVSTRWAAKAEAKPCKSENAECNVNDSNKLCCSGLVCMDKGVPSDIGKCQIATTLTPTPTTTPTPTPTPKPPKDYCKNFEKDQKEIPYGMESIEGICDCKEGFHRVEELEVATLVKKEYDTFTCEEDIKPTPTPTPTPKREKSKPSGCTDNCSVPAPTCPATNTTKEPANFHVYRNGNTALLKWWATEGNKVHAYWKLVGSGEWQHSLTADNLGYLEINDLGNRDWTFGLQQVNDCGGGLITAGSVLSIVDGPSDHWVLWR